MVLVPGGFVQVLRRVPGHDEVNIESDHYRVTPRAAELELLRVEREEDERYVQAKPEQDQDSSKKWRRSKADPVLALESLRALACIMVVFFHCGDLKVGGFPCVYEIRASWLERRLVRCSPLVGFVSGQYSVSIFFTLSGYVLVQGYMRTRRTADLVRQCHKRWIRLAPPCMAAYGAYMFMLQNGSYEKWHYGRPLHEPADAFEERGIIGLLFFAKGSMVQLWTILYEFAAPFFLLCIGTMSPRPSSRGACLRAVIVGTMFILMPLCCTYTVPLSCFAVGFYIAELESTVTHPVSSDGAVRGSEAYQTAVVCLALPLCVYSHWYVGHRDDLEECSHFEPCQLPHSIAAASLVWLIVSFKVLSFLLWLSCLHMVAFLTYSVYLTHLLVLHCLHFWRQEEPLERGPEYLVVITMASATVLHLAVEKPAIWLSGRYAEWMMSTTLVAPMSAALVAPMSTTLVAP